MSPRGICILIATLKINRHPASKLGHLMELKMFKNHFSKTLRDFYLLGEVNYFNFSVGEVISRC